MFIFFGYLEPREWLNNADFALNIGKDYFAIIQGNRISCHTEAVYKKSFDDEIRNPAMVAMNCVALSQAAETLRTLRVNLVNWIELRFPFSDIMDKLTIGHFLSPSLLPIDNRGFLADFSSGLRYASQAFSEIMFRLALEDFTRAIDSAWDEAIYHCQHCLECVRDYFGDCPIMRDELALEEAELREVTDFSAQFIRHGAARARLQELSENDKTQKVRRSIQICQKVIALFGVYLDDDDVHFSIVQKTGYRLEST